MQKIKLTETQKRNYQNVIVEMSQARQAQQMAQANLNKVANHHDSILSMIAEAHGLDLGSFPPTTKINLNAVGELEIGEPEKASERIRKEVARPNMPKSKLKVVK